MLAANENPVRILGMGMRLWCGALRGGPRLPEVMKPCKRGANGTIWGDGGYHDPNCIFDKQEVLYEGAAGTAKTFYDAMQVNLLARAYPEFRCLYVRETVTSCRESIQVTMEDKVLGHESEVLRHGGSRMNRTHYDWPRDPERPDELNGGHCALRGIDRIELLRSSEWDLIIALEATDPRFREWHFAFLGTRARGHGVPHPHCDYPDGIIIASTDCEQCNGEFLGMRVIDVLTQTNHFDRIHPKTGEPIKGLDHHGRNLFWRQTRAECNPDEFEGEDHWLWRRFKNGQMTRLHATHKDNPMIDEDYLGRLRAMPEPARSVYYEGKWTSAKGKVWPTYDPKIHLVRGEFEFDPLSGKRFVTVHGDGVTQAGWQDERGQTKVWPIASVMAGFDWGSVSPSTLQVFALTAGDGMNKVAFRIAEIYRGPKDAEGRDTDMKWWAERVAELVTKYQLECVMCDPNAVASWTVFNMHLASLQKREINNFARPAINTHNTKHGIMGGLDVVKSLFGSNRLFLFKDCHYGPIDASLAYVHAPVGWDGELPRYVLARDKNDNNRVLDYPDDKCVDHGCDASRYLLREAFDMSFEVKPKPMVVPYDDPWIIKRGIDYEREERRKQLLRLGQTHERPSRRR